VSHDRVETLGVLVVRRAGFRRGTKALGLLTAYMLWMSTHDGSAPTLEVLAGETDRSRASWYRDLDDFRAAFPEEESPERIARALLAESRRRRVLSQVVGDAVMTMTLAAYPASVVAVA
jgi:hypothetical protein